jgi:hypothetical protein
MLTGLLGLHWWQIPIALAGLMLLISGPAVILAWFKLRSRNLGPVLDANGWAVNARARINIPFGTSLTQMAQLPEGAQRALTDPYAEKETAVENLRFHRPRDLHRAGVVDPAVSALRPAVRVPIIAAPAPPPWAASAGFCSHIWIKNSRICSDCSRRASINSSGIT